MLYVIHVYSLSPPKLRCCLDAGSRGDNGRSEDRNHTCSAGTMLLYVIHVCAAYSKRREQSLMRRVTRRKRSKNEIALALAAWRKRNKLSQSKAALKLKVSVRTLQEWEQDRSTPRHLALEALRNKIARRVAQRCYHSARDIPTCYT